MNLHLQNKVILVTDSGDIMVSLISNALEKEGAIICRVPLINPEYCVKAVREAAEHYGRIDGLINTLAKNSRVGLEMGDYPGFLKSLEQDILYAFLITQAALPSLAQTAGAIVNLISRIAETGDGNSSGYAAASGARMRLTNAWSLELAKKGIRVNGVLLNEGELKVADTVSFLLSPAATGLQGELIYVDRGYVHLAREINIST